MSGISGGESVWRVVLQFLKLFAICLVSIVAISTAGLWLKGSLTAHGFAMAFYLAGGLVAAGYVLVMLGMNSAFGGMGVPPAYAYYPLDRDLLGGRSRSDEMREVSILVFALVIVLWGGGALLELAA